MGRTHGVEDATGVAHGVRRKRVAGEQGVLVNRAGLLVIAPAADLHVVHHEELCRHHTQDGERQRRLPEGASRASVSRFLTSVLNTRLRQLAACQDTTGARPSSGEPTRLEHGRVAVNQR
jgi:hypothetical protein